MAVDPGGLTAIKNRMDAAIQQNATGAITGDILHTLLIDMMDTIEQVSTELVNGAMRSVGQKVWDGPPASSTDAGEKGDVATSATYLYICIADNVWVRYPFATGGAPETTW